MFGSKEPTELDIYKITYTYTGLVNAKEYVKFVFSESELKKWSEERQTNGVQIIKIEKYEPATVSQ